MRSDELKMVLQLTPIRTLRLHLSTGMILDIKHPELAYVENP